MGKTLATIVVALLVSCGIAGACRADGEIGIVKTVTGACFIVREAARVSAQVGDLLYRQDQLETDSGGAMGFTLKDNSTLSIGGNTRFVIDDFLFDPHKDQLLFNSNLLHGILTVITGEIGKLAPAKVRIQTPAGVVGVRGTRFAVLAPVQR